MKASEAQKKATKKYIEGKTDETKIRFRPKGKKTEVETFIKEKTNFDSLNAFVNYLVDEAMRK